SSENPRAPASSAARRIARGLACARCCAAGNCARMPRARAVSRSPGLLRSGAAQASYVPDEQIQSLRELARLRARLMADRQDYLRQLVAQLDVVLPEHRTVLGDLLTARARGILAQFPTAPHLAHANPRAIRRAAEDAGARGFSLNDATVVRDRARRSLYRGKAAAARAHVVRTLVSQLERLTSAIDEVD